MEGRRVCWRMLQPRLLKAIEAMPHLGQLSHQADKEYAQKLHQALDEMSATCNPIRGSPAQQPGAFMLCFRYRLSIRHCPRCTGGSAPRPQFPHGWCLATLTTLRLLFCRTLPRGSLLPGSLRGERGKKLGLRQLHQKGGKRDTLPRPHRSSERVQAERHLS